MDRQTKLLVATTLAGVAELLSSPDRWTKGTNGRTKDGEITDWHAPDACKFCLNGALLRVVRESRPDLHHGEVGDEPVFTTAINVIASCCREHKPLYCGYITDTNDAAATTHDDVVRIIKCAVTKATAEVEALPAET
jgi:hypothetical protein